MKTINICCIGFIYACILLSQRWISYEDMERKTLFPYDVEITVEFMPDYEYRLLVTLVNNTDIFFRFNLNNFFTLYAKMFCHWMELTRCNLFLVSLWADGIPFVELLDPGWALRPHRQDVFTIHLGHIDVPIGAEKFKPVMPIFSIDLVVPIAVEEFKLVMPIFIVDLIERSVDGAGYLVGSFTRNDVWQPRWWPYYVQ